MCATLFTKVPETHFVGHGQSSDVPARKVFSKLAVGLEFRWNKARTSIASRNILAVAV